MSRFKVRARLPPKLTENKVMFLGSQASGHQALSAFLRGTKSGTIKRTFGQNQEESGA